MKLLNLFKEDRATLIHSLKLQSMLERQPFEGLFLGYDHTDFKLAQVTEQYEKLAKELLEKDTAECKASVFAYRPAPEPVPLI